MKRSCILLTALALVFCFSGCKQGATNVTYSEIKSWMKEGADMTIIDVRKPNEWAAGHIQDAINIQYENFLNDSGDIKDETALTSKVTDKSERIITYCFGYGKADTFAHKAVELGYRNVYYYTSGTNDWDKQDDYYVIEYSALKTWYDQYCPFDSGENYLVDVLPEDWYTGEDPAHPGGHIPGALHIWSEEFYSNGALVDNGTAFTSVVTNRSAKIVVYCGDYSCGLSKNAGVAAAELGYSDVYRYQGGWQEWQDEGNDLWPGEEPGECP